MISVQVPRKAVRFSDSCPVKLQVFKKARMISVQVPRKLYDFRTVVRKSVTYARTILSMTLKSTGAACEIPFHRNSHIRIFQSMSCKDTDYSASRLNYLVPVRPTQACNGNTRRRLCKDSLCTRQQPVSLKNIFIIYLVYAAVDSSRASTAFCQSGRVSDSNGSGNGLRVLYHPIFDNRR